MSPPPLHFVVPGPIDQRTGGYLYDARIVRELRELGWQVEVHGLAGSFPDADAVARAALTDLLTSLPDGARVVVDGLAMGGLPGPLRDAAPRLRVLSLVHHPLADETGRSPAERARFERLEREALAACSGVIVTSEFTASRLADFDVPPERIRAVPPGTEPAPPAVGPGADAPPRLLCVGTVTPRKGHDVLVAALTRVRDLPWTCVCAGSLERDPAFAGAVLERVGTAGLAERVDFVGERDADELDALYAEASLAVLASHYEGYGMALAEALARGLPIVSTTGGAIPFTVPGDAGVLVRPGDPAALADALRGLLDGGSDRRDELAAAARRHAATLPDWAASGRAFAAAVEALAP